MSLQELSNYTFQSRYSQYNYEIGRKEVWDEAVKRIFDTHRAKYKDIIAAKPELATLINEVEVAQKQKRVLSSQRMLQTGGDLVLRRNERQYNCCGLAIDKPKAFQDIMWLLLAGCGVGFSVQKFDIEKLPVVNDVHTYDRIVYTVEDTCEGWADAVGVLLSSYFGEEKAFFPEFSNKKIGFDFSKIRPKGSLIAGQFKAPGPEPLKNGLIKISDILQSSIGRQLKSIEVYDICMHIADSVVSSGLRRSATICLFSKDDEEMAMAKTGKWYLENPQRGRSNNSAIINRDTTSREEFSKLFKNTKQYGEPGWVFVDSDEELCNPCFTISTKILTEDGWRSFSELLDKDKFVIEQDNRIQGHIKDGQEYWNIDQSLENVNVKNVASDARKTGDNQEVFKLTLSCGREVEATNNHHFATIDGMKMLKDISIGEKVLIPLSALHITDKDSKQFKLGYLAGLIFGDGTWMKNDTPRIDLWGDDQDTLDIKDFVEQTIEDLYNEYTPLKLSSQTNSSPKFTSNNSPAVGSKTKYCLCSAVLRDIFIAENIPTCKDDLEYLHTKTKNFKAGFISGYMYADGSSEFSESNRSFSFRLTSTNKKGLQNIQLILQELGVMSRIYISREAGQSLLPDSQRNLKMYDRQATYRLCIGNIQNCKNLLNTILLPSKETERFHQTLRQVTKTVKINGFSKVISIQNVGKQDVYCLVEDSRRTLIANGISGRRCAEIKWNIPRTDGEFCTVGFCNLCEINGKYCSSREAFLEQCRWAAIIGTLQAGYTDFPYIGNETEEFVRHESLLGVSITGWMENPEILLDQDILLEGSNLVKEVNKQVAELLGINQAARLCTVKPAGHTSCILSTSSGIHPHHAKRYIRRVQSNKLEGAAQYFQTINPSAVEESVWSANNTDFVISFLCEVPKGSITKNQINALDLLNKVKTAQEYWVNNGINDDRNLSKGLTHSVSNTITVLPEEWDDVEKYIYDNRQNFSGISLLPASGDLDFQQAPFSTVLTPSELVKEYGDASVFASGLVVDGLAAFSNNLWNACDCALGYGEELAGRMIEPEYPKSRNYKDLGEYFTKKEQYEKWFKKIDWIRRLKQFADRYFEGDVRRATYCCKHVSLWKTWVDLGREYKEVDWTKMESGPEYKDADTLTAQACSGGACELK